MKTPIIGVLYCKGEGPVKLCMFEATNPFCVSQYHSEYWLSTSEIQIFSSQNKTKSTQEQSYIDSVFLFNACDSKKITDKL